MSLRLELLQVARLAPEILGESASLVRDFFIRQQNDDGGFKDRAGLSDLYYTVFAIDGLVALQAEFPRERLAAFVSHFGSGENLDFVHLCCLARCLSALKGIDVAASAQGVIERLERYRSSDGGYYPNRGAAAGSAYGCFLALGAYQDLGGGPPDPMRIVQCLKLLETDDGAWANERGVQTASTNATAAAVSVLRNLGMPIHPDVGKWLLNRAHPEGGFVAAPGAPMPDLLSTATALHALGGLQIPFDPIRDRCLDFVDSLWTNEGGFYGHWAEDHLDCEYTFYGLLALGHLSL